MFGTFLVSLFHFLVIIFVYCYEKKESFVYIIEKRGGKFGLTDFHFLLYPKSIINVNVYNVASNCFTNIRV